MKILGTLLISSLVAFGYTAASLAEDGDSYDDDVEVFDQNGDELYDDAEDAEVFEPVEDDSYDEEGGFDSDGDDVDTGVENELYDESGNGSFELFD